MANEPDVIEQIKQAVEKTPILLFMKGTASFPQCGFSARVISMLESYGVQFKTVDVLSNPMVREGIKRFANWPTIPQLYVGGEFQGGCDIVRELDQTGELEGLLR